MLMRDEKLDKYGSASFRFKRPMEVSSPKSSSHSQHDIDVSFEYKKGKEKRRITLELSRAEAQYLIQKFTDFLNDNDWKTTKEKGQ